MAVVLNASLTAGAIISSDTSGSLQLQTAGTTAMTISSGQVVNFANVPTVSGNIYGGTVWQSIQTGSFTAVSGYSYPINTTSGAITVNLPASPSAGNYVQLTDYAGTFGTNAVTINPNGNKLNASTSNVTLAVNRESIALVYIDSTQGWIIYSGFNAVTPSTSYSVSYLVVAGGGGSGEIGGGGGAGGLLTSTTLLATGVTYSVIVGAGGAGTSGNGANGGNSLISSIATAIGGGGGSYYSGNGQNGGSGGGSSRSGGSVGTGTSGQGNNGGLGGGGAVGTGGGGGGGGASAVGGAWASTVSGNGGAGTASSITGSSVTYAGGGGGGAYQGTAGSGGAGGGGNGQSGTGGSGISGTANTGGGGGGGNAGGGIGGSGGSGVVILSIPTANYTGAVTGSPTITTSGSNTIVKFTSSGSYTA
jgi:hypothetical protein